MVEYSNGIVWLSIAMVSQGVVKYSDGIVW